MKPSEAFTILGLEPDATPDLIKARVRHLSQQSHPDREGGDRDRFNQVRQAGNAAMIYATEVVDCKNCEGKGRVPARHGFFQTSLPCQVCHGSGKRQRSM